MDLSGIVSTKLARRIFHSKNSNPNSEYTPPTVRATPEMLDGVIKVINKRITKRFKKPPKGAQDQCYPAELDSTRRTFRHMEDEMYVFQFLMNLATYIMERVPRLPQIYLYGHPDAGKSTFVSMLSDTLLQGRTFNCARENSKAFVLGMFKMRVEGAVWVEDECTPHTLNGLMEPSSLNMILQGVYSTNIPKDKEHERLNWRGFHFFARYETCEICNTY